MCIRDSITPVVHSCSMVDPQFQDLGPGFRLGEAVVLRPDGPGGTTVQVTELGENDDGTGDTEEVEDEEHSHALEDKPEPNNTRWASSNVAQWQNNIENHMVAGPLHDLCEVLGTFNKTQWVLFRVLL